MVLLSEVCKDPLPFALRSYRDASVVADQAETDRSDEVAAPNWTWAPASEISSEQLKIYATGSSSTTRQTWQGRWDHGEYE